MNDPGDDSPADDASDPLVEAMVAAWERGERPQAEEFLALEPGIEDEPAIRLIFEEFCLRQEAGLAADPLDFAVRFPRWWPELELLLDCRRLIDASPGRTALPEPGDELAGFRLIHELGRGALGRVFLAEEQALADRPVVVKVTPVGRAEHLSLARLQHMNIVPLYSSRVLPDRALQVLCMPFLGGASLSEVLDQLDGVEPARRTGGQVVEALDRVQATLPVGFEARGPFRRHLTRSSYVDAIAWIGLCLAEGLRYAHERDFVHMDIKPSNVLIAGDGQPMLLDFHLAREPIELGEPPPVQIGGTPGYMPLEQVEALEAVAEARPIPRRVDGRADLFALGAILEEALGGSGRTDRANRPPLRRRNPQVSMGLADLVGRCLEPDPADRYPDAAALAADLRRFLDGLPLRGVANRSLRERWRNWRRRSPDALARALVLAVATVVVGSALGLVRAAYLQRVREVESALVEGRAYLDRRQYAEASAAWKRGQRLAEPLDFALSFDGQTLRPILVALNQGWLSTRRLAKADELHELAERIRYRFALDQPSALEARGLIARIESIWRDRSVLLAKEVGSDPGVEADLLDVALCWVDLRLKIASDRDRATARVEALRMIGEAEALLGPSPSLDRERRAASGSSDSSASTSPERPPRSARDHFELGRSLLRSGEVSKAAEQFRLGLKIRPDDFWLNFCQGLTAYRLGKFDEAANAFRVAIALSPESAECFYNRALALGALGRPEEAIDDYNQALGLNPALGIAWLNRGILESQGGSLEAAARDLARALALASSPAEAALARYNLGLVELARGDRSAAIAQFDRAAGLGHDPARRLLDQLKRGGLVRP